MCQSYSSEFKKLVQIDGFKTELQFNILFGQYYTFLKKLILQINTFSKDSLNDDSKDIYMLQNNSISNKCCKLDFSVIKESWKK